jgi:hypothetical protein
VPNLHKLKSALKALQGTATAVSVAEKMGYQGSEQSKKNLVGRVVGGKKGSFVSVRTIDAFLAAVDSNWLELGRMMERLAEADGTPSSSLRRERVAAGAEDALEDLIQKAAGEAAERAADRVVERIREGLEHR